MTGRTPAIPRASAQIQHPRAWLFGNPSYKCPPGRAGWSRPPPPTSTARQSASLRVTITSFNTSPNFSSPPLDKPMLAAVAVNQPRLTQFMSVSMIVTCVSHCHMESSGDMTLISQCFQCTQHSCVTCVSHCHRESSGDMSLPRRSPWRAVCPAGTPGPGARPGSTRRACRSLSPGTTALGELVPGPGGYWPLQKKPYLRLARLR